MRKKRKLMWQLYPSYLIIIVISLTAMALYTSRTLRAASYERLVESLKVEADIVEQLVSGRLSVERSAELEALLKKLGRKIPTRITVVTPTGLPLGDSQKDPANMENHASRPEIKEALAGKMGIATRYSSTLGMNMIYVAIPVMVNGRPVGVVRTAVPVSTMRSTLSILYKEIFAGGIVIVLLAAIIGFYAARKISRPITELKRGAVRFAEGDLHYRLDVPNSEEFAALAEAMNAMASQLHSRIATITHQRNELEAVLSGMVEAVLVIDNHENIRSVNQAAERLFQINSDKVKGRKVQEAIRNTDLRRFVTETLSREESLEGDIVILGDPEKFLQAHSAILRDSDGKTVSALVVLNDVTRLKALENIRRDFVANVSHELKTPITSIKGFLETLRDGALKDPEHAERFLDIIIKHADRLSAIVDDLLSLSRIERDAEKGEIELQDRPLAEVFDAVGKACRKRAQLKNIELELETADGIVAKINATLLEQAIVNLVDNAVKYSDSGQTVMVRVEKTPEEVVIKVVDEGSGIPRDQLERIFERFYRVDKARSRKVGGTGLGLAIVRHIVSAHGGRITVESSVGRGSTFSIYLPAGETRS
jgi:two-component system, OmpR family, phosphate regulon sensor histidine kinase PhoR